MTNKNSRERIKGSTTDDEFGFSLKSSVKNKLKTHSIRDKKNINSVVYNTENWGDQNEKLEPLNRLEPEQTQKDNVNVINPQVKELNMDV